MFRCRRQLSGVTQSWSWEGGKKRGRTEKRGREGERMNESDA